MRRVVLGLMVVLLATSLVGCNKFSVGGSVISEQEEASFRRGKQRLKEGRPDEALDAFLSVINHRHDAPESHLEAGLLYLDRFDQPVLAIYHFNEYLRSKPDQEQAQRVQNLVLSAKKEFARTLPAAPFAGEVDTLDLKQQIKKAQAQNDQLKAQLAEARDQLEHMQALEQARMGLIPSDAIPSAGVLSSQTQTPKATTPQTRPAAKPTSTTQTYTVAQGDTLSSIAQKMWGVSSRWPDIYQANRDTLKNPAALKIGQVLQIP